MILTPKILQVQKLHSVFYGFVTIEMILDAIMDMLNSESWRQAILQQCGQDHHTQAEVKRALSNATSYDGHSNTK